MKYRRNPILRNALITVLIVVLIKLGAHFLGWEILSLNPLFSGIVAANVFIMGFLLSGVLTDYKESEKLPGELAATLETLTDEAISVWETKQAPAGQEMLTYLLNLAHSIKAWFYKENSTRTIMEQIIGLNRQFVNLEPQIPANYIARLKQEQSNLRRILIRIHTIRETDFIPAGYIIFEVITFLLMVGLVLAKIDPFYESLFFVGFISFLFSFLRLLIRDLDNPFGYYESVSTEDVSLKPLLDTIARLEELNGEAKRVENPAERVERIA